MELLTYLVSMDGGYTKSYFRESHRITNCNVQCWDVPDCKVEDKNVEPSEYYFGYTIYYPDGVTGN